MADVPVVVLAAPAHAVNNIAVASIKQSAAKVFFIGILHLNILLASI